MKNYLINFLEDQLMELQIGKDVPIILQKNRDRQIFKEALQTIGRNNLAAKFEKYIATGNS